MLSDFTVLNIFASGLLCVCVCVEGEGVSVITTTCAVVIISCTFVLSVLE